MSCNSTDISKKIWRRLMVLIIVMVAVICIMLNAKPVYAAEEVASGTCGDNMTWILDDEGTLTITGEGEMTSWFYSNAPWYTHRNIIANVFIGNRVTSIGDYAFYGCSSLTSITIPDGVTSIGDSAFSECRSLTSIVIPEGVTSIGNNAFDRCSNLTSVTIPEGVTSIGDSAFYGCSSMTSITIPDGVTSIGGSAFYNCSNLTSITIPDGVTSIGYYAFHGCDSLKKVYINNISNYLNIQYGDTFYSHPNIYGAVIYLNGEPITDLVIPEDIMKIPDHAFSGCSSLTSITIPEGVTSIGSGAFSNCISLRKIDLPEGVTSIGGSTFYNCSNLTSVTIPEGVTSIGDYAFYGCSSMTSVTIPDGVTSIGDYAFHGCDSLKKVYINNISNYLNIQYGDTFYSHPNIYGAVIYLNGEPITDLVIPEDIMKIPDYAFSGCSSLTSITIPEGVTSIGSGAFSNCISLRKIDLPEGVTSIGYSTFSGCSSMTSITIPDGVTSIEYSAFSGCSSLTSIVIPEGVTSIGDYVFYGCSNLTTIIIPDCVSSIGQYVFFNLANKYIAYVFPRSYADRYFPSNHKRYLYTEESDAQKYITFKYDRLVFKPGDIKAVLDQYDTNIASDDILFTIEDGSLFMYDDGKIAALGEGETYLVLSSGEVSERIKLICTSDIAVVTGLSMKDEALELKKGESFTEQITFAPYNALDREVTWSSSDSSVVMVDGGCIEAIGVGNATVTATLADDPAIFATCNVTVTNPLKAIIAFDESFYRIEKGNTQKIGYYIYPYDAVVSINYESSDPDTVSIDGNGYMTAHKNGTADITISSGDISKTVTVNVYTLLKGISLDKNSAQLECEEQIQLNVIFDPEDTTERDIIWTSSNESTVRVDENGLVTPTGKGIATITATAGKYTATCNIVSKWHTEEVVEAVEPTCTETGLTEGKKCSECGKILIAQEVVPVLDHSEEILEGVTPTCTEAGLTEGKKCSVCGEILVAQEEIPALGHSWDAGVISKQPTHSETGTKIYTCTVCGETKTEEIPMLIYTGWQKLDGYWYYFDNDGVMVTSKWMKDSKGWCWLQEDGRMLTNGWAPDTKGMCWIAADGYMPNATKWIQYEGSWYHITKGYRDESKWMKDSKGWCWLQEDGKMLTNGWAKDSKGWCWIAANGYMPTTTQWIKYDDSWYHITKGYRDESKWMKDSKGWCWLQEDGRMLTNGWAKDSKGYCWIGDNGYMVTDTKWIEVDGTMYYIKSGYMAVNCWAKDDEGWLYLGTDGQPVTSTWKKDSKGWCYVGADGYMVTNDFAKDSKGWCWIGPDGYMIEDDMWIGEPGAEGSSYIIKGYRVDNKTIEIDGVEYTFDADGKLVP